MLWILVVLFLTLWSVGMIASFTLHGFLHILIVAAIVMVFFRLILGTRPVA